jgi:hypothetical protein
MFDYDIVPIGTYTDNPRYVAKRVRRGTGRYHTLHQARVLAGELRGRGRDSVASRSRNINRHIADGERLTQRIIDQVLREKRKKSGG